jgi:hypothetical protein
VTSFFDDPDAAIDRVQADIREPDAAARPDPRTWSSDVLRDMSPGERAREMEILVCQAIDESRRRVGPLRPGDIGVRKGAVPTITHVVSTPEERAARRQERDE